jgi:hypothetical protein
MNTKVNNVCKMMKSGYNKYVFPIVVHLSSVCFFAERGTSECVSLLFLIPAALILVPMWVWLCCQWKRCRRDHPTPHSQHDTTIIVETGHHNNNPVHKQQRSNENGFKYTPVSTTGYCCSNECQRNYSHTQYV